MLHIISIVLTILAGLLMLWLFVSTCVMGIAGAVIGAVVCIFVPYSLETCMLWGFGIGMVIQFFADWKNTLLMIVYAVVGLGIAFLVRFGLHFCGVSDDLSSPISMLVWVGCFCFGISKFSEYEKEKFNFSGYSSGGYTGPIYSGNNTDGGGFGSGGYTEPVYSDDDTDDDSDDDGRFQPWEDHMDSSERCQTCKFYDNRVCSLHSDYVDVDGWCDDYQWYR